MARYRRIASDVRLEEQRPLSVRRTRSPQHTWGINLRPWQLVPAFIAPVLPGETMKSAGIQCRIVSDPIKSALGGWWLELYVFYVRVGDLDEADVVRAAAADPANDLSTIVEATDETWYHMGGLPNWLKLCVKPIVRGYFRSEGEDWDDHVLGDYPSAGITGNTWMDSARMVSAIGDSGSDEWAKQWAAYEQMRAAKLTTNTFNEWLAKYGVEVPPQLKEEVQDYRIPELVRFCRDFAFPVPTVDPTTGVLHPTVQWNLAERIDKRRFFAEPGFLVGLMCVRPKVFFRNLLGSACDLLIQDANGFMPPDFDTDPHTALVECDQAAIADIPTGQIWLDRRDLFLHGDQMLSGEGVTGSDGPGNRVALPDPDLVTNRYATSTDADALFVDGTAAHMFRGDGICSFHIASRIGVDTTT